MDAHDLRLTSVNLENLLTIDRCFVLSGVSHEGMPEGIAKFRVEFFELIIEVGDAFALCVVLEWTLLAQGFVLAFICECLNVCPGTQTERTDDGKGHLLHLQQGRHGVEASLEGEVHQGGMENVVLMMAEGNLRTADFLCKVENQFAAVPGAEKARRFLLTGGSFGNVETGCEQVEGHIESLAEVLQVGGVRFVWDILHAHMNGGQLESRRVDVLASGKEFEQTKGILTS